MDLTTFKKAAGISLELATRWHPHMVEAMQVYGIEKPSHQAMFIAQIGTESAGFTRVRESMNYSVEGLLATFPRSRITAEQCRVLGRKPADGKSLPIERQIQIANIVYANRFGNGTSDGWFYRGGGLKQITFADNYAACGKALGLDLLANPDLLTIDRNAALSAGWFWKANGCWQLADKNYFVGLTMRINGGVNGLPDRQARWKLAKEALLVD